MKDTQNLLKIKILDVAEKLFIQKGYDKTTVNDILEALGISKGAFYYYFQSKEDVMEEVIQRFIHLCLEEAKAIVYNEKLSAAEKLCLILSQRHSVGGKPELIHELYNVNSSQLHEKRLVGTILHFTPLLTDVIQEGIQEGIWKTPYPKESVEFLLVGSGFLFNDSLFPLTPAEYQQKLKAFIYTMESILEAPKGSFAFILNSKKIKKI